MAYKYFTPDEFAWCIPSCKIEYMDSDFLSRLDRAREVAGIPFRLYSAYRSKEYELHHGLSGTSAHTKGLAVDISAITPQYRYKILHALFVCGFQHIGIYPNFIHVDAELATKPAVWYGK